MGGQSGTLIFFWNQLLTGQHLANSGEAQLKKPPCTIHVYRQTSYCLSSLNNVNSETVSVWHGAISISDVFFLAFKTFFSIVWILKISSNWRKYQNNIVQGSWCFRQNDSNDIWMSREHLKPGSSICYCLKIGRKGWLRCKDASCGTSC